MTAPPLTPVDVLRKLEWSLGINSQCPFCGLMREFGKHSPTCKMAAALATPDPAPAQRVRDEALLRKAAYIARNGCLVPPDGGSPTDAECEMCDAIAEQILALIDTPDGFVMAIPPDRTGGRVTEAMVERARRAFIEAQLQKQGPDWVFPMRAALEAALGADASDRVAGAEHAIGGQVEKHTGDYRLSGEVRGVLTTKAGKLRYVVEHDPGFLHIYGPQNIRAVPGSATGGPPANRGEAAEGGAATPSISAASASQADRVAELEAENGKMREDYEDVIAEHRRLVREMDVRLNGEAGAAKQASLCDLVEQVSELAALRVQLRDASAARAGPSVGGGDG